MVSFSDRLARTHYPNEQIDTHRRRDQRGPAGHDENAEPSGIVSHPPFNRIEWRLARGYHAWFMTEIEENRVLWPRLGVPASGVGAQ